MKKIDAFKMHKFTNEKNVIELSIQDLTQLAASLSKMCTFVCVYFEN